MTASERASALPPHRRAEALRRLAAIEAETGVRVLFACESGSRAWGFASADSDYDVRFVYARPPAALLALDVPRDVIERPIDDDMDLSGWELHKALRLLRVSNPPLGEWLGSPLVYRCDADFTDGMRGLYDRFYDPARARYHYRSMAHRTAQAYLGGETVRAKKYLYALRPLLAVRWIDRMVGGDGGGAARPPTPLADLVAATLDEPDVRAALDALIARKRQSAERADEPRDAVLHDWIEAELARISPRRRDAPPEPRAASPVASRAAPPTALLDAVALDTLRRTFGPTF